MLPSKCYTLSICFFHFPILNAQVLHKACPLLSKYLGMFCQRSANLSLAHSLATGQKQSDATADAKVERLRKREHIMDKRTTTSLLLGRFLKGAAYCGGINEQRGLALPLQNKPGCSEMQARQRAQPVRPESCLLCSGSLLLAQSRRIGSCLWRGKCTPARPLRAHRLLLLHI